MFVPQARIKLGNSRPAWLGGPTKRRGVPRRSLKWYEFTRMPYLIPNIVGSILGFIILCCGALLCYIGYNPGILQNRTDHHAFLNSSQFNLTSYSSVLSSNGEHSFLRILAYVGPVLMGVGFFVLMVAVVLYCEIRDKFVQKILPKSDIVNTKKSDIYDMVIDEFRKNYFRGIEVPLNVKRKHSHKVSCEMPTLYKALSVSTPAILITPEVQRKWQKGIKLTPKQKRKRILSDHETWLKTSSMPNIRPKSNKRLQRRLSRYSKLFGDKIDPAVEAQICSNNDNTDLKTNKKNSESCFSNPAYRGSPTEPIELRDISAVIPMDVTNKCDKESDKHRNTDVVIHIDAMESVIDSRGITERRHSDIGNISTVCNDFRRRHSDDASSTSTVCNGIPAVCSPRIVITDYPDTFEQTIQPQIQGKNGICHKSDDHLGKGRKGPYKTCIGIVRSESSLHRIRHIINRDGCDGDDSSLDSLTLNEETMKYFELQ